MTRRAVRRQPTGTMRFRRMDILVRRDWRMHFFVLVLVLSNAVLVLVIDARSVLASDSGTRLIASMAMKPTTINERYQMHSIRTRSKGDRRQIDHGRIVIPSLLPNFDHDHEHRFTEHEHDKCV